MEWYSPLFREASKAILDVARQEFQRTKIGQLVSEVRRETSRAASGTDRLGRALQRYSRYGVRDALRDLCGTQFGQFAREVQRYSRESEMGALLKGFLGDMGPAGKLIQALAGSEAKGETDRLVNVLQAFGFEVLPNRSQWKRGEPGTERGIEAAQELLEAMGAKVVWPGDEPEPQPQGSRLPFGIPIYDDKGQKREVMQLPMADGPMRQFGMDHPIVTGEMVKAINSSNVHSFGYDVESAYLYVRFLGYIRGSRGPDGHPLRGGPGSLYRYSNVTPEEFLSLLAANSKGDWVWDHLRIRGTWSGHQKDYELVGVEGGYVPRKATVKLNPQTQQLEEWFVKRRVRAIGGGWLTSAMDSQAAGPVPWGEVDRGRPDNGRPDDPDRGTPFRGW
jgi:hypothetical protein